MWAYLKEKKELIGLIIFLAGIGWVGRGRYDYLMETETRVIRKVVDTVYVIAIDPLNGIKQKWESSENMEEGRFLAREIKDDEQDERIKLLERSVAKRDAEYSHQLQIAEQVRRVFLQRDSILRLRYVAPENVTASTFVESDILDSIESIPERELTTEEKRRRGLPIIRSFGRNR